MSPPTDFLSRRIGSHQFLGARPARHGGGQVERGDHLLIAHRGIGVDAFERTRERARVDEPDRDRLAVQELVPADALQRVRERVAEIQRGAEAGALLGIGGDHRRLHRDARGDQLDQDRVVSL